MKKKTSVEMEHHADEWYLSCANIFEGRRDCSLMARYTDIVAFSEVILLPGRFFSGRVSRFSQIH